MRNRRTRGRQSQKKGPRHCWRKPSQGAARAPERKRDCYDEEKSQRCFTVVNRRHATEQRISVESTDFWRARCVRLGGRLRVCQQLTPSATVSSKGRPTPWQLVIRV